MVHLWPEGDSSGERRVEGFLFAGFHVPLLPSPQAAPELALWCRRQGSERADINIAARPHHAAAYFGWRTPRIVRSGVNAVAASGEELARRGGDGWRSEEATERQMGQTVLPQFPQGKPAGGPVKWARA